MHVGDNFASVGANFALRPVATLDGMSTPAAIAPILPGTPRDEAWLRASRHARRLSWLSLAWMTVEGAVGVAAAVAASSVALLGFGIDSAIEALASVIVIWRFTGKRTLSPTSERLAQQAVAVSFYLLAPYLAYEGISTVITGDQPRTSWAGIAVCLSSIVIMPLLGRAKQRLGAKLESAATAGEGKQNMLCAYLAATSAAALLLNAALGWWWVDPIAGLYIAYIAVREGRAAWAGDPCC
jgi:divalent metal cation (Fe/Co/Zn/Cd) transporter